MRWRLSSEAPTIPTIVDITDSMVARAAVALMAMEAQDSLTDVYGCVDVRRAERFAQAVLEAALDLRVAE